MRHVIAITVGIIFGTIVGAGTAALEEYYTEHQTFTRDCLPGDECVMFIRPKDQPWLNLTCELTNPPRCRDDPPKQEQAPFNSTSLGGGYR